MTKKTQAERTSAKALSRFAAVAAVLLTLCLVFMMPVGAGTVTEEGAVAYIISGNDKVYYGTVTEAINAATGENAIVYLMAKEISEEIKPWASDTTHVSEKSITILGANYDKNPNSEAWLTEGTILTNGMYLGYDDSHCSDTVITVKGITFKNAGLVISGQKVVVIENNTFVDINQLPSGVSSGTANINAISITGQTYDAKDGSVTVKNNKISGVDVAGINLRDSKGVTIEGNNIGKTGHNAITVQNGASGSLITISNNVMTTWGGDGEGRALRISAVSDSSTLSIQNNEMIATSAPEEFVKVTGPSPSVSGNKLNNVDDSNIVSVSSGSTYLLDLVANVDSKYYTTLEGAVAAASSGQTVTLLKDITSSEKATVTIDKSITLDGADYTLKNTYSESDARVVDITGNNIAVILKNLNLEDNDKPYSRGVNVPGTSVTLTVENCNIDVLYYAINIPGTGTITELTVNGGTISGFSALNNWGTITKATFTGAELTGFNQWKQESGLFGVFVFNVDSVADITLDDCTLTAKNDATVTNCAKECVYLVKSSGNNIKVIGKDTNVIYEEESLLICEFNEDLSSTYSICAGTFSFDPSEYLDTTQYFSEVQDDGTYKVVEKDHTISVDKTKIGFDSVKVGYTQPEAQTVTITNDGNVPVTLTAPTSENYAISLDKTALAVGETAILTIQPKEGLAVGNYADKFAVTNNAGEIVEIEVSFLVYQPSSGGSSTTKPEEPVEPVEPEIPVEPENPTEEPEAGEPTVETEVTDGGEVLFEAPVEPETPGADTPSDEPAEPTVTGVELPAGTDSEVAFIPVSEKPAPAGKETQTKKVFEINVPKYEKGKPATVKFTMTVAELAADGKTAADVALWHQDEETGEWTKLVTTFVIIDGVVYFEAITFDFSPFAIVYEDVSAPTEPETPEQPTESPAPILAVLAGLGAAVVLRRK